MPIVRALHCSWALLLLSATIATAQPAAPPPAAGYTIFVRGTPVGREDITVDTSPAGTTVTSTGRLSAPLNVSLRRSEFRYRSDGTPELMFIDWSANGGEATLRTTYANGVATTAITQQGKPSSATANIGPRTILLPNNVFAAYVAFARRLTTAKPGDIFSAYVVPAAEVGVTVAAIATERIQIGAAFLNVRRHELTVANPGGALTVNLTADENGALIRVSIPVAGLDVVREDLAASTSRVQLHSNPGDEPVIIPAVGFNLGGTITKPKSAAPRVPAVILVAGYGVSDRDGFVAGIATLGQLAGAVADAGFLAVRYDKRGFGQSGGRAESATLQDYSDDIRAVVRWLRTRKDVDPDRIAVIGHDDGAWVALQAAAKENRLAAVVSIAGPASTGAALVLEQQQAALDQLKLSPEEREKRIALQTQIQNAVLTGEGWESIAPELRRQADTPWFQSLLAFNPATVVDDVRQPILFVHGDLDRQVPVAHVTQLSDAARKGRSRAVDVVTVRGVNHLLVPAITGDVQEYLNLTDRTVSADVRAAVTGWLTKTFAARK
jgi:dipeptidyl aminopeptidase/acylaminoacyl peptidase